MPTQMTVSAEGLTLLVRAWAADSTSAHLPVVLLPATGETAEDWDVVAQMLQPSRSVFAVNLRGHGGSDWPGTYSIRSMADDVIALLETQSDGDRVDLVGHSLGGLVACLVAADRPDRVRRLVLEDVGLLTPRRADPPPRPQGAQAFDWDVITQVRPEIDNFDPGWADVAASITAPTLIIAGGDASHIPQHQVADLSQRFPRGVMVTIEAGHAVHAAKPGEFTQQLLAFLND